MKWFEEHKDWAPVILRVFFGVAFLVAGVDKLLNLDMVKGMFIGLFGSAGAALLWIAIAIEIFGGLALLANWHSRETALVLSVFILVALFSTWKLGAAGNMVGSLRELLVMNTGGGNTAVNFAYLAGLLALVFGECKQCE